VKWGYAPRNVVDAVDPPRAPRYEVAPPNLVDLARLISEAERADDRLSALWFLAIYSGCRQRELLGLKWDDVDLDLGTLRVRRTLVRATAGVPVFNEPKTTTSRRTLSLAATAVAALPSHKSRQNKERLALREGWSDYDLVFTSTIGTPLNQRNVIRLFKTALE
jgi:integrase